MKEITVFAGDYIGNVCAQLAKEAPAFAVFNDIRVEANPGETAGDIQAKWQTAYERRHREYIQSAAYKEQQARAERQKEHESKTREWAQKLIAESGVREKYPWTAEMGEISGFGGGYETACRDMVYVGLAWIDTHPGADLSAYTTKDAKELEKAILDAEPGCSGAMVGAAMLSLAFIALNGWDAFVEQMKKRTRGLDA